MRRELPLVFVGTAACGFSHGNVGRDAAANGDDARADGSIDTLNPDANLDVFVEAEAYSATAASGIHSWSPVTTEAGFSGTSYMQILPADGASCTFANIATCSTSLELTVPIAASATYYIHVRMFARTYNDDSVWYGVDNTGFATPLTPAADAAWHWGTGASVTLGAGNHTIQLWQREAGARVDVVAVTQSATPPP